MSPARLAQIERLLADHSPVPERRRAQLGELVELHVALRAAVEDDVRRVADGFYGQAARAARHLIEAGGKRLRPVMALLACAAAGGAVDEAMPAARAVELLHTGSLLHDDVVDRGETRRGRPAAGRVYGDPVAVLAGDYCIFAALDAIVAMDDAPSLQRAMTVARMLTEGELRQLERRQRLLELSVDDYLVVVERKTGSLFALAGYLGARSAGPAGHPHAEALWRFGLRLGMAFQVVDDLLDLCGEPEQTGKSIGADLAQGTITLPVILALQEQPGLSALLAAAARCREEARPAEVAAREARAVAAAVSATSALERTRVHAARLTGEALGELAALPASPYRTAFERLAEQLLGRQS